MGGARFLGAKIAFHADTWNSGRPPSCVVGTFLITSERSGVAMATALIVPAWTCETTALCASNSGDEFLQLDLLGGIVEDARRPGQAVMLAQGCSGVFGPEQPPALQQGDHLGAAARRLDRARVGKILRHERSVERQVREIVTTEPTGQSLAADHRVGQIVDFT